MALVLPFGAENAPILIVGEAPGQQEEAHGVPLVGNSGVECGRLLFEAGLVAYSPDKFFELKNIHPGPLSMIEYWRSLPNVRLTNVSQSRPPENKIEEFFYKRKEAKEAGHTKVMGLYPKQQIIDGLKALDLEVAHVKPQVIIAFGNTSFWACTGLGVPKGSSHAPVGISTWRGSELQSRWGPVVIPTYHPAYILRSWEERPILKHDLQARVKKYLQAPPNTVLTPPYQFTVRPTFDQVMAAFDRWDADPDVIPAIDTETRRRMMACICIAFNKLEAISIPFICVEDKKGYWNEEQEIAIRERLKDLLSRRKIRGQNFLYDEQYIAKELGVKCVVSMDTMFAQRTLWAGLPGGLDFLSSMYCHFHQYWKDEGKEWHQSIPEEQLWIYNCKDGVTTFEVAEVLEKLIDRYNLRAPYEFLMRELYPAMLRIMLRGVRADAKAKGEMVLELMDHIAQVEQYIYDILGHHINTNSSQQMNQLFYNDFGLRVIRHKKTKRPTVNKEALEEIGRREPILRPLTWAIDQARTYKTFLSNFVAAPLDEDDRWRCSYNMTVETYRFGSSENAFGTGTNLQNIPRNKDAREKDDKERELWKLALARPQVRRLFIPDRGKVLGSVDLDRADLQVVVWEADDPELKQMLREGVDVHAENAKTLGVTRQQAKQGVHLVDYGGSDRTLAVTLGITMHEANLFRSKWFAAHPSILEWHRRIQGQLERERCVYNKFGFRRYYFDRTDDLLPEALAWVPQSTVAIVIDKGWVNIEKNLPWANVLLQVHDELVIQYPASYHSSRHLIRDQMLIPIPYDDPLIIPVGLKYSDKSWGECESTSWQ